MPAHVRHEILLDADDASRSSWGQIIALYRGPLGGNAAYPWIEPGREHLRLRVADTLTRCAQQLEDTDIAQAIAAYSAATDVDPHNQALYRTLMRLHADQGRPDAVTRTLDLLRRRLADIDDRPEPATLHTAADLTSRG